MGKGGRVPASRVARVVESATATKGAAFGLGRDGALLAPTAGFKPVARQHRSKWAARVRQADQRRAGLAELGKLAAARATLGRDLAALNEEIANLVGHLRLDGASWVEVGGALRISRQGARQRFGGQGAANTAANGNRSGVLSAYPPTSL